MTKKRQKSRGVHARLHRIECKCDRIFAKLQFILGDERRNRNIDIEIERLHRSAVRMKEQCDRDREAALRLFGNKLPRR